MNTIQSLIFYTGNKGKFREIKTELNKHTNNVTLIQDNIDIPEIQSTSNKDVVEHKLQWIIKNKLTAQERLTTSVIVEDTGLYINSPEMNGFPGALVKYYLEHLKTDGICAQNGGSPADAVTYIGLWNCKTQQEIYFRGAISGFISMRPRGENGFGYDPCFVPLYLNDYDYYTNNNVEVLIRERNHDNLTFAELTDEQKAQCNMRTICAAKLFKHLLR